MSHREAMNKRTLSRAKKTGKGFELSRRLFGNGTISPEDVCTFELIPQEIVGLPAETAIGTEELDLSEIQDVVLSMEYDITRGGP
jgi:hypothetical protein